MYELDTPAATMMESVRVELIALGDPDFVPETDCAAWQWWMQQDVVTVADFIDRVVERFAVGDLKQGWVCSFLIAAWADLHRPSRERLVKLLDGGRAVLLIKSKDEFTEGEKEHLRAICAAYLPDRPYLTCIVDRKLGNGG